MSYRLIFEVRICARCGMKRAVIMYVALYERGYHVVKAFG